MAIIKKNRLAKKAIYTILAGLILIVFAAILLYSNIASNSQSDQKNSEYAGSSVTNANNQIPKNSIASTPPDSQPESYQLVGVIVQDMGTVQLGTSTIEKYKINIDSDFSKSKNIEGTITVNYIVPAHSPRFSITVGQMYSFTATYDNTTGEYTTNSLSHIIID